MNFVSGSVIGKVGRREVLSAAAVSLVMVLCLDLITNSLDIGVFHWDHDWYIDMARHGFASEMLTAPFAYRFGTPLLAGGLHAVSGLSLEWSFRLIAYAGAVLQLTGLYWLLRQFGASMWVAAVVSVVIGLQLMNLRFLLFDVYRPDHLAYGFVVLGTWLALRGRLWSLAVVTIIGLQFREYAILPLLARIIATFPHRQMRARVQDSVLLSIVAGAGMIVPRLLIPVESDLSHVTINVAGGLRVFSTLTSPAWIGNAALAIVIYATPVLLLVTAERLRGALRGMPVDLRRYLFVYTLLACLLLLIGGHGMSRFATFLFLPLAVLLSHFVARSSRAEQVLLFACMLVGARVFMHFPQESLAAHLDFTLPNSGHFEPSTLLRALEVLFWVGAGVLLRLVFRLRSKAAMREQLP